MREEIVFGSQYSVFSSQVGNTALSEPSFALLNTEMNT